MVTVQEKRSKYYTDLDIKAKIDALLMKNASIEASLGLDSSYKEREKAKVKQYKLFLQIKELCEIFFNDIVIDEES